MTSDQFDHRTAWLEPPQPQDLILTLLADNVRNRHERVWSSALSQIIEEFGFSASLIRASLARLARRNLIGRQKRGRFVAFHLTPRAEQLFAEGDRRIFTLGRNDQSDGKVTLLIHSMPSDMHHERARLSRRLRFLGFGSPQDGVWICAGHRAQEVTGILEELGVGHFHSIIVGRLAELAGAQPVLDNAWNFQRLHERYKAYVEVFAPFADAPTRSDREALHIRTVATHNYRQFPVLDPGIDSLLHPAPAYRAQAISLFRNIHEGLAESAHRYFDQLASDTGIRAR
ncbi:PaaX family transcriptional regulator [Mycobacterium colombiense]|nr:PaaX family transcriptional regulator C-terminal domain-containing protein [Mycobacterium colombiense]